MVAAHLEHPAILVVGCRHKVLFGRLYAAGGDVCVDGRDPRGAVLEGVDAPLDAASGPRYGAGHKVSNPDFRSDTRVQSARRGLGGEDAAARLTLALQVKLLECPPVEGDRAEKLVLDKLASGPRGRLEDVECDVRRGDALEERCRLGHCERCAVSGHPRTGPGPRSGSARSWRAPPSRPSEAQTRGHRCKAVSRCQQRDEERRGVHHGCL
eukprot:scaffold23575_cov65-Phaeocystis_antarctica.AAC.1